MGGLMDATTTRVPAVIDALLAALEGNETGFQVIDGPPAGQDIAHDVIMVGLPSDGGDSVNVSVDRAQGLGHRYTETFDIWCTISSLTGDNDMKARRDRCHEMLVEVDAILKASRGLGGVADLVGLGPEATWAQGQTDQGAVCEVSFQIVGRAAL